MLLYQSKIVTTLQHNTCSAYALLAIDAKNHLKTHNPICSNSRIEGCVEFLSAYTMHVLMPWWQRDTVLFTARLFGYQMSAIIICSSICHSISELVPASGYCVSVYSCYFSNIVISRSVVRFKLEQGKNKCIHGTKLKLPHGEKKNVCPNNSLWKYFFDVFFFNI